MPDPAPISYRKLPGRTPSLRFGLVSVAQSALWLGPDHVLKVESTPGSQSYKRFDYADIQELFVQRTSRQLTISLVFGGIVALVVLGFVASNASTASEVFGWILGLPALITLIVNIARGPTCEGYLRTAVGVERIPSFARLRPTLKAIDLITAEVEKVQGRLPSTDVAAEHSPAAVPAA